MDIPEASTERVAGHDPLADLVGDHNRGSRSASQKLGQSGRFGFHLTVGHISHDPVRNPKSKAVEQECLIDTNGFDCVSQGVRCLDRLPMLGPIVLVPSNSVHHLIVAGFCGDHRSNGPASADGVFDQALPQPRLARTSSADQKGEHRN